jgi:rhodanese-related sulfurtransferase
MLAGMGTDPLEIDAARAAELARDGAQLVDVRERYEVDAGRIDGSRHIGLAELTAAAGTIDPLTPVVFYCRVGARSLMAADAFRAAGYRAYSLAGGLLAWVGAGLPITPHDGHVANH